MLTVENPELNELFANLPTENVPQPEGVVLAGETLEDVEVAETSAVDETLAELADEVDSIYTDDDEMALNRDNEQKFPGGTDEQHGRDLNK